MHVTSNVTLIFDFSGHVHLSIREIYGDSRCFNFINPAQ